MVGTTVISLSLHHCGLAKAGFGDHGLAPFSYTPRQVSGCHHMVPIHCWVDTSVGVRRPPSPVSDSATSPTCLTSMPQVSRHVTGRQLLNESGIRTDTLGQLARCMGVENFLVYAPDCVSLGLGLMERKDDPDVRKTCYLLFASLASVMKGEMAVHLPKIMDRMMLSLRSTDGVVVSG
ncbi:Importin-4 [Portunus trituberculatus]|uniref:Importin-4 n=1 Tax=Portunus trituberculatus TaxID=210409 RepID=A0A5B7HFB6_PORTR|nr:Importin-4 [Portunus trituberculatus]